MIIITSCKFLPTYYNIIRQACSNLLQELFCWAVHTELGLHQS